MSELARLEARRLGQALEILRAARGRSQEEVARTAGVRSSSIPGDLRRPPLPEADLPGDEGAAV